MFDLTSVQELRSSSGIPIYLKNLPWVSNWVQIRLLLSIGAKHDPIGREGLAHFYEHSLFWGNNLHKSEKEIWNYSDANLFGSLNGSTGFDWTVYSLKAATNQLGEIFNFLRELIFSSRTSEEDLEKEKRIITHEIWRRFKAQEAIELNRLTRRHVYGNHPFARCVTPAGYPETVASITIDDLLKFRRFYNPLNMRFVFVGDISPAYAKMLVDGFTREIEGFDKPPLAEPIEFWPNPDPNRFMVSHAEWFKTEKDMVKETSITLTRPVPLPKNTSLLILTTAIIEDLLFQSIRRKLGATYDVTSDNDFYGDFVNCSIRIPFSNDQLPAVQELIEQSLSMLASGVFPRETITEAFNRIKNRRLNRLRAQDQTAYAIANDVVEMLRAFNRVINTKGLISETEPIELEEVIKFAQSNFTSERVYQLCILP